VAHVGPFAAPRAEHANVLAAVADAFVFNVGATKAGLEDENQSNPFLFFSTFLAFWLVSAD
jgi:hypothetical protein